MKKMTIDEEDWSRINSPQRSLDLAGRNEGGFAQYHLSSIVMVSFLNIL
jgi:hypothetical protein